MIREVRIFINYRGGLLGEPIEQADAGVRVSSLAALLNSYGYARKCILTVPAMVTGCVERRPLYRPLVLGYRNTVR